MALQTVHEWDADGKHFRAVHDEDYQSEGSYAYDSEEETARVVREEQEKLSSGSWVALGIIVTKPCEGCNAVACRCGHGPELHTQGCGPCADCREAHAKLVDDGPTCRPGECDRFTKDSAPVHCAACSGSTIVDSLWGIVIECDRAAIERFAREGM